MIKLPGLIDPHVHLRTPGQTDKEDFLTGTQAALAGGFTTILDMPNNLVPITSEKLLNEKKEIAAKQIVCDIGFYFGSLGNNLDEFEKVQDDVFGLKIFLNQTTGNFIVDLKKFQEICDAWPNKKPILLHAEEDILEKALQITHSAKQKIHVCHVSSQTELQIILHAKNKNRDLTCGVTPHHLFLTKGDEEKLGPFARMKPYLKTQKDVDFLWKNLENIDVIESDHAPHALEEKQSTNPPFGVPGLETTLPLLLTAANQNKISINQITRLCHDNTTKIFGLPPSPLKGEGRGEGEISTWLEIDENEEWVIQNNSLFTKCKWTPFDGWEVKGKIKKITIRDTKVFENDKILVKPGFGKVL